MNTGSVLLVFKTALGEAAVIEYHVLPINKSAFLLMGFTKHFLR